MNRDVPPGIRIAMGAAIFLGSLGLPGCSNQGTISEPKAAVEGKRDALQKATQSGIPGKGTAGPAGRRR